VVVIAKVDWLDEPGLSGTSDGLNDIDNPVELEDETAVRIAFPVRPKLFRVTFAVAEWPATKLDGTTADGTIE